MIRTVSSALALLVAAAAFAPAPLAAPGKPALRATVPAAIATIKPDVAATRDILTLGDLVSGLPVGVASEPAFRAPALGETGTIQSSRIIEAVRAQGVEAVSDGGSAQVVVTRTARRLAMVDIEAAVRRSLEERYGVDARSLSLALDNGAPTIVVEPDLQAPLQAHDIAYDARSRRLTATLAVPGSAALRLKPVRVAGQMIETVEVIVPSRNLNRGDIVQAGDVTIERRPRETTPQDVLSESAAVVGKAARRSLGAGQALRASDLQRQEIVARNELVTVVYEAPGLVVSMRGRAQEAGAQGDMISVQNVQSKKILQATVIGAGRVVVNAGSSGRVAAAN